MFESMVASCKAGNYRLLHKVTHIHNSIVKLIKKLYKVQTKRDFKRFLKYRILRGQSLLGTKTAGRHSLHVGGVSLERGNKKFSVTGKRC